MVGKTKLFCTGFPLKKYIYILTLVTFRLASFGILGKEREPRAGKLGWNGNFDTEFERNYFVQNPVCGFFELF